VDLGRAGVWALAGNSQRPVWTIAGVRVGFGRGLRKTIFVQIQ
jgi:hypothetical protein